jgi:hypothetical protein
MQKLLHPDPERRPTSEHIIAVLKHYIKRPWDILMESKELLPTLIGEAAPTDDEVAATAEKERREALAAVELAASSGALSRGNAAVPTPGTQERSSAFSDPVDQQAAPYETPLMNSDGLSPPYGCGASESRMESRSQQLMHGDELLVESDEES